MHPSPAIAIPGARVAASVASSSAAAAAAAAAVAEASNNADAASVVSNWADLSSAFPVPSLSTSASHEAPTAHHAAPVYRVVLTGGPCGGKTTALAEISERFRSRGFGVYVVPEAATLLFGGGCTFAEQTLEQITVFQAALLRTQMALEDSFCKVAAAASRPSVVLCDRGAMDGRAYMSPAEWAAMLRKEEWDAVSLRDERYDLVIHMVSAADGASDFYQLANNAVRTETPTEATVLDRKTQEAWVGHPQLRIIDNRTGFKEKIDRVFRCIGEIVGVHVSKRPVRKFLVAKDVRPKALEHSVVNLEEFEVEQTFLMRAVCAGGVEESVRRRGQVNGGGACTFVHKVRRPTANGTIQETKRQISNRAYLTMLGSADPERRTVRIKRQCFVKQSQYFVMDTILNVEPTVRLIRVQADENQSNDSLELPSWIKTEREVTGDPEWTVYAMSSRIVPQRMKLPLGSEPGHTISGTDANYYGGSMRDTDSACSF